MGQAVSYGTRLPWAPSSLPEIPMKSRRYATRRLMRRLEKLKAYFLSRYSEAKARADGLGDPAQLTAATWEASTWDEAIGFLSEIVDGKQSSISARGIGVSHVSENGLHRLPSHLMAHLGIPNGGAIYVTAEISPGVVTIESEKTWLKRAGLGDEDSMSEDYAHGFRTDDIVTGTLPVEVAAKFVVTRAYEESIVIRRLSQDALSVNGGEVYVSPRDLRHAPPGVNDWVRDIRLPREAPVSFSADLHEQRLYYVRVAPPKQEAASADFEPGDIVTTLELDGVIRYIVKSVSLAGSSVDITNQDGLTKTIEPKFLRRPDVREGDWVRCPKRPQDGFFVMPASDMARVSKFVPVVTHFPSAPAPAAPREIKVGDTVKRAGGSGVVTDVRGGYLTVETDRGTRYWRNDEVTAQTPAAPPLACDFKPGDIANLVVKADGTVGDRCIVKSVSDDGENVTAAINGGILTLQVSAKKLIHHPIEENEEFWVRCTEHPGKTFHMSSEEFEAHEDHFAKLVPVDGPEEEAPRQTPPAGFRYTRDNADVPPEPSPEPPTEPSGPQGDEEVSVDHALFNAFAAIASSLEPESQASDPSDVYDQLVSSDYCNKLIEGSSLKKPARVGDLFVSDGKAFMVRLQENYKKPSTPTVERVTRHMGYHLSHGLNDIREGDAIAAKINRALVPAILMPETMNGKCPEVYPDRVLSVGALVKMPDGSRGVVMGYHDGAYMIQRELVRCGHERLLLGLDAAPGALMLEDNSAKFLRSICEFISSGEYSLDIIQIGWGRVHVDFDVALAAYTKWLKKETVAAPEPKSATGKASPNPEDDCVFEFLLDCKGVFGDNEIKSREFLARFPSDTTRMFVVTVDGHFNNAFATEAQARAVVPNANGVATIRSYDLVVTDRGKDGRPGSGRGALREIFAQPSPSPERRVRPRKPGPNQVIELHQSAYLPEHVSQDEELVLRELDTNSNAGWWTAWWPRKAAVVRIRLSDWEPVSAPPSPGLVFAVNLGRYRLSPVGKHALVGAGPRTLHSTIDSAQQQVAQHRVLSPRWTKETPRLWVSERGADDTVLRIEITEEKVW